MPIERPYRRTCRQFVDGKYAKGGRSGYILHLKYAKSPEHYIRAFLLLLKDMQDLFYFIEPSDTNLGCYSFRVHELLLRACVEVEANCKAILLENGYSKNDDLTMEDYKKVESSHKLSSFEVLFPVWKGGGALRKPFSAWANNGSLSWYQAYNKTKHDRHEKFEQATLENMIDAISGLLVILSSQFHKEDFSHGPILLALSGPGGEMESAIGGYLRINFPDNWPTDQRYDFDWQNLMDETDPFQEFPYPSPNS